MSLPDAVKALADAVCTLASALQAAGLRPVDSFPAPFPPGQQPGRDPAGLTPTLAELVNEFLRSKARAGCSDRYLRQLKVTLKGFAASRGKRLVTDFKAPELEKFLLNPEWTGKTRRGYLNDLKNLFGFGVRRDYLAKNPAAGVPLPALDRTHERPIGIHAPDQVRAVLAYARRKDLNVCRLLAIRYFAGVRSAEAKRLRESDIKRDLGFIEVSAAKSKTRSRRLVTIQPALAAWLDLGGELGPVGDMSIRKVLQGSKVPWTHNATRHSFVSYHLAHFGSAAKTALEAGHSEAILFRHYRALVTADEASQFWDLRP